LIGSPSSKRPGRFARPGSCFIVASVTARILPFDKIVRSSELRRCVGANDRETGKKRDRSTNRTDFPGFPDVVLSYQARPIPRIVRPSDKPVSRGRPIVSVFNPAETT
jgi:hypothetical protein